MRKIVCFIYGIGYMLQLSAQVTDKNPERFGFRAGLMYNAMNFNAGSPAPAVKVKNIWKPGIYIGGSLQFPLDQTFSIQPEYLYNLMQGTDDRLKDVNTLHYLSLPVLLKIKITERIGVVAGPAFGLLIHASGSGANITHDTEERSISAIGGLEIKITHALIFEGRYVHGLNHIGLGQRSAIREFKWRGIEAGLALRW